MHFATNETSGTAPAVISLNQFCQQAGISPITAWRWRRLGWLETINVAGRQYLTDEGLATFKRRAAAGEFARQHVVPNRGSTLPH